MASEESSRFAWVARPKVYQDVQRSLYFFTVWWVLALAVLVYALELPPDHRRLLGSLFGALQRAQWAVGTGFVFAVVGAIGWLLIFHWEVYDKWWDKYLVRWRYYYSVDFIIPRLYRPFDARLGTPFYKRAGERPRDFMKPFYFFVGDDDDKLRIGQNLITRFYVRVTKYWVAQIVEVLLVVLLLSAVPYAAFFAVYDVPTGRLLAFVLIVALLLLANSIAARSTLGAVREATEEEIEAIHGDPERFAELERRTQQLCADLGLTLEPRD
jgi:hypothetical protein